MERKDREMPVLLIAGYLGSGKTTLLNRILSNTDGIRFAVIVNDIGEVIGGIAAHSAPTLCSRSTN